MEISSSNIKKFLTFSYVPGNENPENIFYIFSKDSFSYISENENPGKNYLYFRKRNFLIFQKGTCKA